MRNVKVGYQRLVRGPNGSSGGKEHERRRAMLGHKTVRAPSDGDDGGVADVEPRAVSVLARDVPRNRHVVLPSRMVQILFSWMGSLPQRPSVSIRLHDNLAHLVNCPGYWIVADCVATSPRSDQ